MVNRQDFRPNTTSRSGYSEHERKELQTPRVRDRKGVVDSFILGTKANTGNKSLSTDGNTLYSYQTAIATKQSDGTIVLNNTKYSSTTSQQQSELKRQLDSKNIKYDVTGGKARGYSGEDLSKKETNIEYLDYVEYSNAKTKFVKTENGDLKPYSDIVKDDGSSNTKIERNAIGYPVLYSKGGQKAYGFNKGEGRDYSKEYSGDYQSSPKDKQIIRFYSDGRRPKVIQKNVTLADAQAHCKRPDTRKEGKWFDGYDDMNRHY